MKINNSICHIIGAGDINDSQLAMIKKASTTDIIIAADGGCLPLIQENIVPDYIIGDFDSCPIEKIQFQSDIPVTVLPTKKDFTDIHVCIEKGLELGCNTFHLYGATGGRTDHTFANIQLLNYLASNNKNAYMYGNSSTYIAVHNSTISLPPKESGYISIFSLTDNSYQVSIKGLMYSVDKITLSNTYPLGVSNEYIGKESSISVTDGTLLIIY